MSSCGSSLVGPRTGHKVLLRRPGGRHYNVILFILMDYMQKRIDHAIAMTRGAFSQPELYRQFVGFLQGVLGCGILDGTFVTLPCSDHGRSLSINDALNHVFNSFCYRLRSKPLRYNDVRHAHGSESILQQKMQVLIQAFSDLIEDYVKADDKKRVSYIYPEDFIYMVRFLANDDESIEVSPGAVRWALSLETYDAVYNPFKNVPFPIGLFIVQSLIRAEEYNFVMPVGWRHTKTCPLYFFVSTETRYFLEMQDLFRQCSDDQLNEIEVYYGNIKDNSAGVKAALKEISTIRSERVAESDDVSVVGAAGAEDALVVGFGVAGAGADSEGDEAEVKAAGF